MFKRLIQQELEKWAGQPARKPLVLRGARQVGKTTAVRQFAAQFPHFISLNLEVPADRKPFLDYKDFQSFLQALFFLKGKSLADKGNTLVFIDEIQELPQAMNLLRYFHEHETTIKVIAAGSMLETVFDPSIHFPVGRVEYKVLRPVSFPEFLAAIGESSALEALMEVPVPDFAHDRLLSLYHQYAIIGGMPEVVNHFAAHRDFTALQPIYDSLIASYIEDVEKYARNPTQAIHLRHVIRSSFKAAGQRIRFEGFGQSAYRSREMGECFRILEKVLLLNLLYPVTSATLPILPDHKRHPRLQILDTGLLNYFAGIQREIIGTNDLNEVYRGIMIEHLSGQELLSTRYDALGALHFFLREKTTSSAEVDFIVPWEGKLIPIEIKSGTSGRLRSLHAYMDQAPHDLAVRFYNGKMEYASAITPGGKQYRLLSLPYYLVTQLTPWLNWMSNKQATR